MRCEGCGVESPLDALFIRQRRSFGGRARILCPECVRRRREAATRTIVVVWAFAGVLSLLVADGRGMRWPANVLLCLVFEYISIVPHELAHAAAALLVRMDVFRITIGTGQRWGHVLIRGTLIEARALPVCGAVAAATLSMRGWRFRRLVFFAAGPAANVTLCLGAVWLAGGWRPLVAVDWTAHLAPLLMFALANALLVLVSLFQRRSSIKGAPMDGVQILRLLFRPLPSVARRRLTYFISKTDSLLKARMYGHLDALVSGFRDELSPADFLHWRGIVDAELGNFDAARAAMVKLLETRSEPSVGRAIALNTIAWNDLVIGSSELLPEADRYSAEAYSLLPWSAAVQSTRGWALVEIGEVEAGLPLLRQSLRGAMHKHDRASILCTLSIAEARRGCRHRAAELLQLATQLDPQCTLLARAENELNSVPITA